MQEKETQAAKYMKHQEEIQEDESVINHSPRRNHLSRRQRPADLATTFFRSRDPDLRDWREGRKYKIIIGEMD